MTILHEVDWLSVAESLMTLGWARIRPAVTVDGRRLLAGAAPATWRPKDVKHGVRYHALFCGAPMHRADQVVRQFANAICDGVDAGSPPGTPSVPRFNEATWTRDDDGVIFISPHRDPSGAGGIIAVLNLYGSARFRVWGGGAPSAWITKAGDLVLLRGNGWPEERSLCPFHEAQPPLVGSRMVMTLRHNRGGSGAEFHGPADDPGRRGR